MSDNQMWGNKMNKWLLTLIILLFGVLTFSVPAVSANHPSQKIRTELVLLQRKKGVNVVYSLRQIIGQPANSAFTDVINIKYCLLTDSRRYKLAFINVAEKYKTIKANLLLQLSPVRINLQDTSNGDPVLALV